MELIDRDALGVGCCNPDVMLDPAYAAGWNGLLNIIKGAPAVDPVRHGRWVYNTDDFTPKKRCTNCGYNKPLSAGENIEQEPDLYCGRCGAKMEAPKEEN